MTQRSDEYVIGKGLEQLAGISKDGYLIVDKDGYVLWINKAFADFLHVDSQGVVGKYVGEVVPITEMPNLIREDRTDIDIVRVLNTREIDEKSKQNLVLSTRGVFHDDQGQVLGAVSHVKFRTQLLQDISKLDDLYAQLNSYKDDIARDAMDRLHMLESQRVNMPEYERMAMCLQYYQEELLKRSYADNNVTLLGDSPAFIEAKKEADRTAHNSFSVLITGSTGTGKEVMADYIHYGSDRKDEPFVKVNCAAIPGELFESELFGYVGGAFTGALKQGKKGKFEIANHGTIFLDEIADMPLSMQAKILRVLQEKEVEPIGAARPVKIDVRVIAATRHDVEAMVREGKFRIDLYYRLNEIRIQLPDLKDRQSDIDTLAKYLLNQINEKYRSNVTISDDVIRAFHGYHWPGNVRELNNVIKSAFSMADNGIITLDNLPRHITQGSNPAPISSGTGSLREKLEQYEKEIIIKTYMACDYNAKKTAESLGIFRSNLYKKLEKYGIDLEEIRRQKAENRLP